MRLVLDTNVFISYLLQPSSEGAPQTIVRRVLGGEAILIANDILLDELTRIATRKPAVARQIDPNTFEWLHNALSALALVAPFTEEEIPAISRDPGDDYLVALAVLEGADYLVTGDKDLLVLGQVAETRIVSPAAFVAILDRITS
jgi:putative PIN family toxin of toxin-antitoxin system